MRYGANFLGFALLSEIPWDLLHTGKLLSLSSQNVFFTLFLGFAGLYVLERFQGKLHWQALLLIALFVVASLFQCDYGSSGFCFILLLYVLRELPLLRGVIGAGFLSSRWKAGLAFIPIAFYNGKRGFVQGPILKFVFYGFYPVHILILYFIKLYIIGY